MKVNIIRNETTAYEFIQEFNAYLNVIEKFNGNVIDIKYVVYDIGPNIVREVMIIYEEGE